ncbi:hypothetical protein T492DRAFT_946864 [Pavlovales sp. CCMP2436]|nr:hypothetical protein T492DRAFT_946864 [Pavlovales sp. CCMP2436]|mmetsp:Transcript_43034/g.106182  ORF Transcript_43034/g.106182 Transcript_43034/m.106182 type:complete len:205 (-) Transcript_43034:178-792(-)
MPLGARLRAVQASGDVARVGGDAPSTQPADGACGRVPAARARRARALRAHGKQAAASAAPDQARELLHRAIRKAGRARVRALRRLARGPRPLPLLRRAALRGHCLLPRARCGRAHGARTRVCGGHGPLLPPQQMRVTAHPRFARRLRPLSVRGRARRRGPVTQARTPALPPPKTAGPARAALALPWRRGRDRAHPEYVRACDTQ